MSGFVSALTPFSSLLEVMPCILSQGASPFLVVPNVPGLVRCLQRPNPHSVSADADPYDASRTLGKPSSSWNMAIQLTSNDITSAQTLQALGSFGLSEVRKRTYLACAGFSSVSILRTWGLLLSQG